MTNDSEKHQPVDIDCVEAFDHFYEYLNGELNDPDTRAKLEHHLGHCRSCYSRSQMEKALNERMKNSGKRKTPVSLQKRLRDLMKDF